MFAIRLGEETKTRNIKIYYKSLVNAGDYQNKQMNKMVTALCYYVGCPNNQWKHIYWLPTEHWVKKDIDYRSIFYISYSEIRIESM